jgi:membrane-bound lytic murein transglycosylase A
MGPHELAGTARDWHVACAGLPGRTLHDDAAARDYLETWFVAYRVTSANSNKGRFTGYYEPKLNGALAPTESYKVPIYGRPADLLSIELDQFYEGFDGVQVVGRIAPGHVVPYYSRAEIDNGALLGRGIELLWVDDAVDAFVLHIQGSGRIATSDGSSIRVGFSGSNGHPFFAVGRALIAEGKLESGKACMGAIRDWMSRNEQDAANYMQRNDRYIFFRTVAGEGPIGALGVPLTAGRSLAIDPKFIPLGAPIWLNSTWPRSDRPLRRLMVAQDVGGAIKGPIRGDFYWGSGDLALEKAGCMNEEGEYYVLLPKSTAGLK